jgi:hypothetical protein
VDADVEDDPAAATAIFIVLLDGSRGRERERERERRIDGWIERRETMGGGLRELVDRGLRRTKGQRGRKENSTQQQPQPQPQPQQQQQTTNNSNKQKRKISVATCLVRGRRTVLSTGARRKLIGKKWGATRT